MTGAGNVTWRVPGPRAVLIDAGTGKPEYLAALEAALAGCALETVVVTHNHSDHASGVTALASAYPSARFWKLPWPEKDPRYPVAWQPLHDGDRIETGAGPLDVVHTPGHAPDHICLWHAATRTLFSSDLALASSTVVVPASSGGDMTAYLASLERALALEPARMLPAHGPVIKDPATLLRAYIRHRRAREAEILQRLATAPQSLPGLVATLYSALPSALEPMATDGLLAHLIKLEREGRVRRDGDRWTCS